MEILNQKRNQIIALFALLAVGMIAFTIYRFVDNLKYDSTILVYTIPDSLTVSYDTIKDQKVTTRAKHAVKSGSHIYTFRAKGFADHQVKIDLKQGEEKKLFFAMKPLTEEAKKEAKKEKYNDIREAIGGHEATQGGAKISQESPLINKLPHYSRWFYIVTCNPYRTTDRSNRLGICIVTTDKTSQSQVDQALSYLKKHDKDIDKYDIKINGKIYPTAEELEKKRVVPCGGNNPPWCYMYTDI